MTEIGFTTGSLLCAVASGGSPFAAGRIIEGLMTGLMLVIALPPLTQQYPLPRLATTAAVVNIGLFGAVAAGPLLGGATATGWRWLFAGVAALGAAGVVVVALLSVKRLPPFNRGIRPDFSAFMLAALGTALPFYGSAQLAGSPFRAPKVWAPLAAGLAALCALILTAGGVGAFWSALLSATAT